MKRFTCIFLICILLSACLAGCSKEQSLAGTWNTQIDLAKILRSVLKTEVDTGAADLNVDAQMTFQEDGAFSLQLDKKSFGKAVDSFFSNMTSDKLEGLENALKDSGLDSILSLFGTDTSAITDKLEGSLSIKEQLDQFAESASISGFYKTTGNHLFLFQEKSSKLPNGYIVFNLAEDTLTLEKHIGTNPFAIANLLFRSLPLTFTKA